MSNIGLFDGEPLNNNILLIRTERGCHDRCASPRADLTGHFAFLRLVQMYKITNEFNVSTCDKIGKLTTEKENL